MKKAIKRLSFLTVLCLSMFGGIGSVCAAGEANSEKNISREPKYSGYITDIKDVLVGHYTDEKNKTGCTAILFPKGAVAGSDVRGGAPGTRETDLTKPGHTVEKIHGICLSGGSAYGLAAAQGVMEALEEKGCGFDVGVAKVPIVCGAVLFDLTYGSADVRPTQENGYTAAMNASASERSQGSIGAGTGATVGKFFGLEYQQRSGLGSACVELPGGVKVAALVAVNALGDIYDEDGKIIKGACENGVFKNTMESVLKGYKSTVTVGRNTTIGVIVTNAKLNKEQINRVAMVAHNGYALSIRPVHTMQDGDSIFAAATGEKEASVDEICIAAEVAMQRAVINAAVCADEL